MFISKVILLLRYNREDATKILVLMINTRNAAIDWKQEIYILALTQTKYYDYR